MIPFAVTLTFSTPHPLWPEQGEQTWQVEVASDGARAWAWADVQAPPATFLPPGSGGTRAGDHDPDGRLLVWRREAIAVEYDLRTDTARICDAKRLHRVDASGAVTRDAELVHAWSQIPAGAEPLLARARAALADADTFDPAVRAEAERRIAACDGLPLDLD